MSKTPKYQDENPLERLHPNEPFFFVRAQDLLSFDTVAEYAHLLTKAAGQAMRDGKQDLAQSLGEQAAQVSIYALEFLDWQKSNPDKVHYPD
jgi:hypothetical protein